MFDPATPTDPETRYLHEEYQARNTPAPALRLYYRVKPLAPHSVQMALRRQLARRQATRAFPAWPIEPQVIRNRANRLAEELRVAGTDRLHTINPWPRGHRCAIILTHDVEGTAGIERIPELLALEQRYGFVSSWNFVGEGYPLGEATRTLVRDAGCEVGLHGITHDGALFRDRASFEASLPKIRKYLREWDAVGFRSPSTLRRAEWMHELPVLYDSSYPDTDPFQPQAGGCCWIFPYFFGEVIELPMTLDQDHTLFVLLRESSIERWTRKARWVIANRGLVNVNVHPDYMNGRSLSRYEELLEFLAAQDGSWHPLPREVASWWKERSGLVKQLNGSVPMQMPGHATRVSIGVEGGKIVYDS